MAPLNLVAGWCGLLVAVASGAVIGLGFHRADWLGGYGSWRRRLLRLGHIAGFGLGMINLAFAWSLPLARPGRLVDLAAVMLVIGLATMTPCCWLAAWRPVFRHGFIVPVLSTAAGIIAFICGGLVP